jgi:DNA-binding transcriptional LysR family regulator
MEPVNLKSFYRVAVCGSFSKAAEELFVSQPALSRQIAALEKELGLQLFHRQGRGVALTEAGRRLFIHAEKILGLFNEAQKEMLELKDLSSGELLLGAGDTIANYLLPSVLAVYHKKNTGIKLSLHISHSSQIQKMILENKLDLALTAAEVQFPGLYQEKFAEDELNLVVPPDHSFINMQNITAEQLSRETFLCREAGSDTRRLTNNWLDSLNLNPSHKITLGSIETIKRGIINNLGISFLSKYTFENEAKLGLLVPLMQFKIRRPLRLIYAKGSRLSPAALAFTALIKRLFI